MVASGDFTSADGPGGKASRFLDAVVAFVVGIFQPIFHFLLSAIFNRKPRQHKNQNRNRDNTLGLSYSPRNVNNGDGNGKNNDSSLANPDGQDGQDGGHQGDESPGSMQPHSATVRHQHAYGPKAHQNARPPVKPALPQIGPAVDSPRPVKQESAPTNGVTAKTALEDVTNGVIPTSKHHIVGEREAEENLHDQVDLAPAVQPVEGEEEPEDPAKAGERAIHHGFMDQALDMVCPASSFLLVVVFEKHFRPPILCLLDAASLPLCQSLVATHHIVIPSQCFTRSFCRVSNPFTGLQTFYPRVGHVSSNPSSSPSPKHPLFSINLFSP
jgi:hypothetical protein